MRGEQTDHGLVRVDDVEALVGDHQPRRRPVERALDAQALRDRALLPLVVSRRDLLSGDVRGELDDLERPVVRVEDRIVGALNPDLLPSLADPTKLRALRLPGVQSGPELGVLRTRSVGGLDEDAMVLSDDLVLRVPHDVEKVLVRVEDDAVQRELYRRHRARDRLDLSFIVQQLGGGDVRARAGVGGLLGGARCHGISLSSRDAGGTRRNVGLGGRFGGEEERDVEDEAHAIRSLVTHSFRTSFGLGRSGRAKVAPIILIVHGGAWMIGDKAASGFVLNKVAHWLPKGYIIVSSNYRMSRRPNPLEQADDIARALAFVQAKAPSWGGDPARVLLVGHSAGTHLVSLLAADPRIVTRQSGAPWLGTIILDSAALNLVEIMQGKHKGFYDRVFGEDHTLWTQASPYHRLTAAPAPMFVVCSLRSDGTCPQARTFASKAIELGGKVTVLPVDLKHSELNKELGQPSEYTTAIEEFMHTLGLP